MSDDIVDISWERSPDGLLNTISIKRRSLDRQETRIDLYTRQPDGSMQLEHLLTRKVVELKSPWPKAQIGANGWVRDNG